MSNLPEDSRARKNLPIAQVLTSYFPKAIAYVALVAKRGNDKHNPGEPLHWARDKSPDHEDCIVRHTLDAGKKDGEGVRHSGGRAWRALAALQLELEAAEAAGEQWWLDGEQRTQRIWVEPLPGETQEVFDARVKEIGLSTNGKLSSG